MSLLVSAYKRALHPPPRTAASNLREGGHRAIFQRPPVYLGSKPTPPRREGSGGGRPKSRLLPRGRQQPRRPARPSPRKGPGGEPRAAAPVPRSPPTSCSPAPARSAGPPAPEPAGRPGPGPRVPRRRGGRGPESLGRRGRPEPRGSREDGAPPTPEPARAPGA